MDGAGNVYIADFGDRRIRKVTGTTINTIPGNGTACSPATAVCGDGGAATSVSLNNPEDVAVDGAGNLYIADTGDHRIREPGNVAGERRRPAQSNPL